MFQRFGNQRQVRRRICFEVNVFGQRLEQPRLEPRVGKKVQKLGVAPSSALGLVFDVGLKGV